MGLIVYTCLYTREVNRRTDFPVRLMDGRVVSSLDASTVFAQIPVVMVEFVFVSGEWQKEAKTCVKNEIGNIIKPHQEDNP